MDAFLVDPLGALPEFANAPSPFASLAFRNLQRGVSMGLPSGAENVARMMGAQVVLSDEQLWAAQRGRVTRAPGRRVRPSTTSRRTASGSRASRRCGTTSLKEAEIMNHGHHLGEWAAASSPRRSSAWPGTTTTHLFQMPRWNPSVEKLGLGANPTCWS